MRTVRRSGIFGLCFLLLSASVLGQSTSSDTGIQALVAEVRELRKDLRAANGYALKVQVALYRFQLQQASVDRALQRLNEARSKLMEIRERQRSLNSEMGFYERQVEDSTASPAQRKGAQDQIAGYKAELQRVATEEEQRQAAEIEAEQQVRTEQAKLGALEDRIGRLENELDNQH